MKKVFLLVLIIGISVITTGFTQNYIHPNDFYKKMKIEKEKQGCFIIEGKHHFEGDFKAFYKDKKLRIEYDNYMNLGQKLTTIYKNGVMVQFEDDFSSGISVNLKDKKSKIGSYIPVYKIFNWNDTVNLEDFFVEGNTIKNGFNCRLLTNEKGFMSPEFCVSEQYGIIVYEKFSSYSEKDKNIETTIRTIKTGNDLFSDDIFNVPKEIKIRDIETIKKL